MGHELYRDDQGRYRSVYARGLPAWHRLGEVFPDLITPEQAFERLFRDLRYVRLESLYRTPDGQIVPAPKFCHGAAEWTKADGTVEYVPLLQVSDAWQPIQPRQAFDVIGPALEATGLGVEASGILGRGERLWICCRLPESWDCGGDPHNRYVNVHLPLDGCLYVSAGDVRVVCANTYGFYREFEQKSRIRIPHKGDIAEKVGEARTVVGNVLEQLQKGEELVKAFRETEFPDAKLGYKAPELFRAFLAELFDLGGKEIGPRTGKTLERWMETYLGANARIGQERSVKRLFDATTEFVDWNYKQDMALESAHKSILFGAGADLKDRAFAICAKMAEEGPSEALLHVQIPEGVPEGMGL